MVDFISLWKLEIVWLMMLYGSFMNPYSLKIWCWCYASALAHTHTYRTNSIAGEYSWYGISRKQQLIKCLTYSAQAAQFHTFLVFSVQWMQSVSTNWNKQTLNVGCFWCLNFSYGQTPISFTITVFSLFSIVFMSQNHRVKCSTNESIRQT